MYKYSNNKNGFALPMVLIIFVALMIFSIAFITVSSSETRLSVRNQNGTQAYFLAKSGVKVGMIFLSAFTNDPSQSLLTDLDVFIDNANEEISDVFDLGDAGTFKISFEKHGDNRVKIISKGLTNTVLPATKTVTCVLPITPRGGEWIDNPEGWVRSKVNYIMWDDVSPDDHDYKGYGVQLSGGPSKSPQAGDDSVFRASIFNITNTNNDGDTFWQQPQTNNFTFDAEIIRFNGRVWTRSTNDFLLGISKEVTESSLKNISWHYNSPVGFEDYGRYSNFIYEMLGRNATMTSDEYSSIPFEDNTGLDPTSDLHDYIRYGVVHFADDVVYGNSKALRISEGYYYYKNGANLVSSSLVEDNELIPITDDDLIEAIDKIYSGFNLVMEDGIYDDK